MHKNLKFSSNLIPLILSREKVSAWRLWDDKDLSVGDIVDFFEFGGDNPPFAVAKLTKVIEKPLEELTAEDKLGHEKFKNDQEMYETYMNYYKREVNKNTVVKLVWFEIM